MDLESRIISMVTSIENPKILSMVYAAVKRLTERERQRTGRGKKKPVEVFANDEAD